MTLVDDINLEGFVMTKDEFSRVDLRATSIEAGLLALRERKWMLELSSLYSYCYNNVISWKYIVALLFLGIAKLLVRISSFDGSNLYIKIRKYRIGGWICKFIHN